MRGCSGGNKHRRKLTIFLNLSISHLWELSSTFGLLTLIKASRLKIPIIPPFILAQPKRLRLGSNSQHLEAENWRQKRQATPPSRGKGRQRGWSRCPDLDRRTKAAQTAVATKAAIMSDLGGEERLSTLERIMVENAAMSAAVLRDAHVRWMSGEAIPVSELATLENTFNRTAQALGLCAGLRT